MRRPGNISYALAAALLVSAVVLLGLGQSGAGKDALASLGLRTDADGYTELAFAAPARLPKRLGASVGDTIHAPFTLRNRQGSTRTYSWVVERRAADGTRVLARGTTGRVASGETLYVSPDLPTSCSGVRALTTVRVAGLAQTIDFWSSCQTAKGRP